MPISSNTESGAIQLGVGDPQCPHCHGLGYVSLNAPVNHPDFGKLFPCTCRMAEIQRQRSETMRLLSNLKLLERYTFENFSFSGVGLSPERQSNLRSAYERAFAYARRPQGWLLLRGGYGCGKTHLAAAIANICVAQGMPVIFITVPDLLDHLRAAYAPTAAEPYDERFEQIRTTQLLILDDLGTENATSWAAEKLFQLLNHRYMAQLPTVITTNHDLEEMDPRVRSRLADAALVEIVSILAPDYRQSGVDHAESELNTLALYADMTFEAFDLRRNELERTMQDHLERAVEMARSYAVNPSGMLVFTGAHGCGKTHLAAAIANEYDRQGHVAIFMLVPDLLDHLRAAFSPQSAVSYDKRFDEARHAPFLVLDDLGAESATPWAAEKLFQLINHRYRAKLPTILTTARPLEDLDPKIRTRLLDVRRCTVFGLLVPPYRILARTAARETRPRGRPRSKES